MTAYDRVRVNTATTGTGAVIGGTAYQAQWQTDADASVSDSAALILLIEDGYSSGLPTAWEISDSVYTLATRSFTRVLRSSSTGSLLDLSGSATVAIIGVAAAEINQLPYKNVANTFTATQTITPAANTEALTISGGSLTGSNASSFASISGTWNTSGTPSALDINITDTASNASSLLANLSVGGTSKASVRKSGLITTTGGFTSNPVANHSVTIGTDSFIALRYQNAAGPHFSLNIIGDSSGSGGPAQIRIGSTGLITWESTSNVGTGTRDLILSRNAAATLRLGDVNAAAPISQTLDVQGSRSGTDTNVAGANLTVRSGIGTGNATGSSLIFQTPLAVASGTGAQTSTTRLTLGPAAGIWAYPYRSQGYTVATLPAGTAGDRAHVTDALAPAFITAVVGGGAVVTPVFYDGANWIAA